MKLYSSFYRDPTDWRELIETLNLTGKLGTQFRRLSGGQKQRLSIALALVDNPEVAVLDELTTGLDPQARRDTWALIERIRDRGVTVLLVTHFMEDERTQWQRQSLDELHAANTQLEAALRDNAALHSQLLVQAREAGAQDERQRWPERSTTPWPSHWPASSPSSRPPSRP